MEYPDLNKLAQDARDGTSEQRQLYMAGVARAIYAKPKYFGFRNSDEIGETFSVFWSRIEGLPTKYLDLGSDFQAYLATSLRFMARTVRRRALMHEDLRYSFLFSHRHILASPRTSQTGIALARGGPRTFVRLNPQAGLSSTIAFHMRLTFVCVKCSHQLVDEDVSLLARAAGMDEARLLDVVRRGRHTALQVDRIESRRRGRDSSWFRMVANRRRLSREVDPCRRKCLIERIRRDTELLDRTNDRLRANRTTLSNSQVAAVLGVAKSTVDRGLGLLIRQHRANPDAMIGPVIRRRCPRLRSEPDPGDSEADGQGPTGGCNDDDAGDQQ